MHVNITQSSYELVIQADREDLVALRCLCTTNCQDCPEEIRLILRCKGPVFKKPASERVKALITMIDNTLGTTAPFDNVG